MRQAQAEAAELQKQLSCRSQRTSKLLRGAKLKAAKPQGNMRQEQAARLLKHTGGDNYLKSC